MADNTQAGLFDAPVLGSANNYTAQAQQDSGIIADTGNFISAMAGAVVGDLYNSSGAVIKFAGGEGWEADTKDIIASYDNDAADFYGAHQGLVDGAELLATSIIPGTLGIKALRAAQAGASGSRILSSLGLGIVNPAKLTAARAAAAERAMQTTSTWNSLTGEMNKALALGVAVQTLDAAAFGAAAMVATNASPLYKGMSATDMIINGAEDSLLFGGAIGGLFSAAKSVYVVKGAATAADRATIAQRNINTGTVRDAPSTRIAVTAMSYADAVTKNGGVILQDTTSAVKATINDLAQSMVPESDSALRVAFGNFATRFHDAPVEAANMFGKLKGVGRIVQTPGVDDIRISGQAVPVDITTGEVFSRVQDAPYHLGDTLTAGATIARGAGQEVKIRMGTGSRDRLVMATSDIKNAEQMAASYWHAADLRTLPQEVEVSISNIPLVERMLEESQLLKSQGMEAKFKFLDDTGEELGDADVNYMLRDIKVKAARELAAAMETPENIAARLNVSTKFLDNPETAALQLRSVTGRISGMESIKDFIENPRIIQATYDIGETTTKAGVTRSKTFTRFTGRAPESVFDASLQGRLYPARLVTSPVAGANTALYEQQARAYIDNVLKVGREARELASNIVLPELDNLATKEQDLLDLIPQASRSIGVQTLGTSANNDLGTLGSMLQKIGSVTKRAADAAKERVNVSMMNASHQIANDAALGTEWQFLQQKLRTSPGTYVLDPAGAGNTSKVAGAAGSGKLIRQDIAINQKRFAESQATGKKYIPVDAMEGSEEIAVSEKLFNEVLTPHTMQNNERLRNRVVMDNQHMPGSSSNKALENGLSPVYHIPVDTSKFSHFVFVQDKSRLIGNGSGNAMMVAVDAEQLMAKRAALEAEFPDRFEFVTKGNTKNYHKALGDYQYERGMNENFVDSTLRRTGKLGDLMPAINDKTNKIAAEEFLGFHQRAAVREVRDAVEMRNANAFQQLDFLGKQLDDMALSEFSGEKRAAMEAKSSRNPYRDAVNMALDIGSSNEFPRWMEANAFVERLGDSAFGAVTNAWESLKNSSITGERFAEEAARLNKAAEGVGLEPLYSKLAASQFKDQLPTRPVLRKFIAKAQAGLNGLMLGLDPIQAINNGLGQVMFAAEFQSLIKSIEKGDARVGALAGLTKVQIPGMEYSINSAIKLHAQATRRFLMGGQVWDEAGGWKQATRNELREEYTQHGLLTSISQQYHQALDDLTLSAKSLSDSELTAKWEGFLDKARSLTGNRLAEEYTRFVAADAARQLTDAAMSVGAITSKAVASTYWNTAVNRIHGVNIASQRAVVFQGVIGQSVGMFMTYQHNLMQQLFRFAAEGDSPAMKALAVSQFGLYGMQGLPAFNAIATHFVGNAKGNAEHTDPYTYIAKNMGGAAEWVLYGAGSNALGLVNPDLKMNLYSRGDISPRQITVFPTRLEDTVLYTSTVGAIGNMLSTVGNIANGAPVGAALLHGLEHNNLNRPLSGLGAVMQGVQTSKTGTVIGDIKTDAEGGFFDKWNLANFVRIAGAKPLDDAAAADAMYRVTAYQAKTTADLKGLAESMRIAQTGGKTISAEDMDKLMQEYAKRGGNIRSFRGFAVQTYKSANSNQVMDFAMKMRSPGSQQVAAILGATNDEAWMVANGL